MVKLKYTMIYLGFTFRHDNPEVKAQIWIARFSRCQTGDILSDRSAELRLVEVVFYLLTSRLLSAPYF